MRKKLLFIILSILILGGITVCLVVYGNKTPGESNETQQIFSEEKVLSQLETKEYTKGPFLALTIKNNSECNVSLTVHVDFLDEAGNVIGGEEKGFEQFEKGYEKTFAFKCEKEFAKISYTHSVKEYTKPCLLSKVKITLLNIDDQIATFEADTQDIPADADVNPIIIKNYTLFLMKDGKIVEAFECKHEKQFEKNEVQNYSANTKEIKEVPEHDGYLLAIEDICFAERRPQRQLPK